MVPGFNHNVKYKGQVFHVQTEDSGIENPHIITHLFIGGNIVKTQKTAYNDLLGSEDLENKVKQLMQAQHKQMLRSLVSGQFDDKIAERSAGASMLNGPAPLNVERGQDTSSNMMSLLGSTGGEGPVQAEAGPVQAAAKPATPAPEPVAPIIPDTNSTPAASAAAAPVATAPATTPAPTPQKSHFPGADAFLADLAQPSQSAMPIMPPPSTVPKISDLGPIHRAPTSACSGMAAAAANLAAMQSSGSRGERLTVNMSARSSFQVVRPQRTPTEETSIFDLPPATNYDRLAKPKQPASSDQVILDGDSLNNVYQSNPDAIESIFGSSSDSSLDDVLLGYLLSVEQN